MIKNRSTALTAIDRTGVEAKRQQADEELIRWVNASPARTQKYGDVLVTMNPPHAPAAHLTQGQYVYEHPLYTIEAVRAQEKLETLQDKGGVSYCGAWTKYGFHEDGFSSGLKVGIEHLGGAVPFEFVDSTYSRGDRPVILLLDHVVKAVVSMLMIFVRIADRVLGLPGVWLLVALVTFVPSVLLDLVEEIGIIALELWRACHLDSDNLEIGVEQDIHRLVQRTDFPNEQSPRVGEEPLPPTILKLSYCEWKLALLLNGTGFIRA